MRPDAVESSTLRARQLAMQQLVAEELHPAAEECRLRILKLRRQVVGIVGLRLNRIGTGQRRAADVVEPLCPTASVELHPAIDAVLGTIFALLDDARQGGTHYWLGELPEALQERLESFTRDAMFIGLVGNYVEDPVQVVRLQQQLLADLQRKAGPLADELLALAATLRARGKAELAALMEAAARRLAQVANSPAVEMDGLPATWVSRPDPAPPPQVLSGHSIWPHGPPSDAHASSHERVASGERRALVGA